MEDTWFQRDMLVLDAAVSLLDEYAWQGKLPDLPEIAERAGLSQEETAAALTALSDVYVTVETPMGGISSWFITRVSPVARKAIGQWPTPETVIARLAAGLDAAAETEPDPERRRKLKSVAGFLTGTVRSVATDVLARIIERSTGIG